jgi:hypothetical protein
MSKENQDTQKGEAPPIVEEKIVPFQYSDEEQEFQELEIEEDLPLQELLDSDFILLFVDPIRYRVWVWQGANTTTRMKFISAKIAPGIRDQYGIAYKITSVNEGDETLGFKVMIGLEEEINYEEEQTGPAYMETKEDLALLKALSHEKILLLLDKAEVPEGYERKMIIVKNKIYGYREYEKNVLGTVIKEKKLFPLQEEVEDGTYLADGFVPRMLFSFNNVVFTELLKKIDDENN